MGATESVEALGGRRVVEPELAPVWTREEAVTRKHAPLRVYLGAAPGVGKTYAMLSEGQRRGAGGTDVVVGICETYGRPLTIKMLEGLEVLPRKRVDYRGTWFEEMDTEALIARRPQVALVDELAHTNVPGSRRSKRWEDVLDILEDGIEVITTLNVQHLESLNDLVAGVTGIRQKETMPDWVVDLADQFELVDISPQALRRRMVHGDIYPERRTIELALQRFFTEENLTALRELALMRVANRVDSELLARWSRGRLPETRERFLVCVSRPQLAEDLVRRGARMAQRSGGELLVLHVNTGDRHGDEGWLDKVAALTRDLGGEFHVVEAGSAVEGVLAFAYARGVTQCVVGEPLRPHWQEWFRGSFINKLIRRASNIDIHVIARKER